MSPRRVYLAQLKIDPRVDDADEVIRVDMPLAIQDCKAFAHVNLGQHWVYHAAKFIVCLQECHGPMLSIHEAVFCRARISQVTHWYAAWPQHKVYDGRKRTFYGSHVPRQLSNIARA